jgi:hypothetical protein
MPVTDQGKEQRLDLVSRDGWEHLLQLPHLAASVSDGS